MTQKENNVDFPKSKNDNDSTVMKNNDNNNLSENNNNDTVINISNKPSKQKNEKKKRKNVKFFKQFTMKKVYITGIIAGVVALILNSLALWIVPMVTGKTSNTSEVVQSEVRNFSFTFITSLCIFAPLFEELIFRRCIFYLVSKWNLILAYLASGILYSLMHVDYNNLYEHIVNFMAYFLIGLVFSYAYDRDRCILASIIAHAVHNTMILVFHLISIYC